jgi:hypothetical protein
MLYTFSVSGFRLPRLLGRSPFGLIPRSLLWKTGGVGDMFSHYTQRFQSTIFNTHELAHGFFHSATRHALGSLHPYFFSLGLATQAHIQIVKTSTSLNVIQNLIF